MSNFFKFINVEANASVFITGLTTDISKMQISVAISSSIAHTSNLYFSASKAREIGEAMIAAADAFDAAKLPGVA